ncbi:carbonic anhydrase [Vulcaniibacterium tengchongense]|uniref:Carbonic anhydrase n=1 Tax=Vulcaniibacterium tengchongense TaxID=1273429 RepID=A0A3N4VG17_9GAMM|nr:carbonic anhydrase family protein [Vulcaniibacterium tengchongense]RPE81972.1 carbonic anhydrase [Vulcaniibacterium tengchongense]
MRTTAIAAFLALTLGASAHASEGKLDYDHQERWQGALDHAQSPIDIVTAQAEQARADEPLGLQLWHTLAPIDKAEDNGHAVQIDTHATEAMIRGRHFSLTQFHFHAESEHTLDGKHYPLEGHFVFKAQDGRLAVIGVMYQVGAANPAVQAVIDDLDAKDGRLPQPSVDVADLMPERLEYYHYLGSLTTPPLTENVEWYVLPNPVTMSKAQMDALLQHYRRNNRNVQPLNGRPVLHYRG